MTVAVDRIIGSIRADAGRDDLRARLTTAALVTSLLAKVGARTIVVGGTAVDAYVSGGLGTSEAYPAGWQESLEIGTIVVRQRGTSRERALAALAEAGFEASPTRGSVRHTEIPFAVDLVGSRLPDDYSQEHLQGLVYEAWQELGLDRVLLVGPEDLLFDYMESAVDTRHQRDWARALAIVEVMVDHLDLGYLYTKAHRRRDGAYVEALGRVLAGKPLVVDDP